VELELSLVAKTYDTVKAIAEIAGIDEKNIGNFDAYILIYELLKDKGLAVYHPVQTDRCFEKWMIEEDSSISDSDDDGEQICPPCSHLFNWASADGQKTP
jgi:hypothetical protein